MADNFNLRSFLTENKLTKNAKLLNEARVEGFDENQKAFEVTFVNKYGGGDSRILNAETPEQAEEVFNDIFVNNPDFVQSIKSIEPYQVPAAKPQAEPQPGLEGVNYNSIELDGIDSDDYPDFVDAYVISAEFEDGTPLSEEELEQLTDELYQSGELSDMAAQSLFENKKKPVMENLTAKERRLVEMVQNALGVAEETHQNADPNVPNDSTDMAVDMMKNGLPEGDEMVQDKPLPKYESIEELMKEIEHGTNEAAHKYKMEEMKRVYEALEAKVGSLEEGEHAEHIDQKAVKQMRKDIAALRKAEEKLRKEFDKKFSGKEKKTTPAKEKATEALQENIMENFNLKKFLVENKLTTNSRMLNEKLSYDDFEQMIKPFLDLAKSKGWVWNSSGNSWYDMISPAIALFHKDVLPTTKDGEYKGQPTELGTNPVAGRSINVSGPLETKSADVIMSPDYNIEQVRFSAKDKTILDSIKGAMANNTDVIQDIKQTSSEFTSSGDFEPQNYYVMLLRKKGA